MQKLKFKVNAFSVQHKMLNYLAYYAEKIKPLACNWWNLINNEGVTIGLQKMEVLFRVVVIHRKTYVLPLGPRDVLNKFETDLAARMFALCASMPLILDFCCCSRKIIKGRPYSSNTSDIATQISSSGALNNCAMSPDTMYIFEF